ncbi:MAG TPA: AraC family transcriptional regulator ligand-binding domain-containing protein [Gemmatimonadaceae bacterium]
MPELTIAASGVRALLELAVSKGAGRKALAERSRIDPADLQDCDNRVAFSRYVALMRAGQELCNDPALALHFGEAVDVTEISLACGVGGFETIDEAFAQVNRYSSLGVEVEGAGTCDRYQLRRSAGQLWIVDARRNPNDFPELTESSFARMVCSTRRTFGDVKFFKELHVTHAEPAYRAEYERIFRVPVVFGSDENALRIDEALVSSYRLPPSSQYVTGVLREHAESLLKKMESSQSTRGRVERLLIPILHTGDVGIDRISSKLGLSRQTLFRKLKAEGVTFEEVLEELRCSIAHHYLNDRKASVKETAYLVGFSDPASFSRAFKRWTGRTPGARQAANQSREMAATP